MTTLLRWRSLSPWRIVAAVEEGRIVYTNIRRFIKYILGSNIGEILTIAAAPLLGLGGVPLSPLQILWMNLVTDGVPALALALEPGEPDVMQRQPFQPNESIFARGLGGYILRIGLIFGVVTIGLMKWAFVGEASPIGESHPCSRLSWRSRYLENDRLYYPLYCPNGSCSGCAIDESTRC